MLKPKTVAENAQQKTGKFGYKWKKVVCCSAVCNYMQGGKALDELAQVGEDKCCTVKGRLVLLCGRPLRVSHCVLFGLAQCEVCLDLLASFSPNPPREIDLWFLSWSFAFYEGSMQNSSSTAVSWPKRFSGFWNSTADEFASEGFRNQMNLQPVMWCVENRGAFQRRSRTERLKRWITFLVIKQQL